VNGVLRNLSTRRAGSAGLVVLMAGAGLTGAGIASAAPAAPAHSVPAQHAAPAQPRVNRAATVVQEHRRRHFGLILTTVRGRALYYIPSNRCNSACLAIWPPLLMPVGKTIPKGATCLGTARFGRHRLQVTYRRHRLFTFVSDSGITPTGNGVGGFKVAKVVAGRC
jgi:predicted lipoprotein with Yx(FWY)xxD motif